MLQRVSIIFLVAFLFSCATTKQTILTDNDLKANLKKHISILASDEYMGRETGTKGEELAMNYIISQFKEIGLKPKGEKKFVQEFPFSEGATFGPGTQLYVNDKSFKLYEDFYPLQHSGSAVVTGYTVKAGYGIYAPKLNQDDYANKLNLAKKIFVLEASTPDGNDPHGKYGDYDLKQRVEVAKSKGASAVIFINSDTTMENPKADFMHKYSSSTIPVIFAKGEAARMLKNDIILNCTVGAEINKIEKTGHNIIGFIDNKAANTIVIGAHYDHLGMGSEGSLYRGEPAVHNGADDNASGTAALIELARMLSGKDQKNNYLMMAFSGEEKGLLGSNYFIKHPTVNLRKVNYMINMDMLGRLKPDEPILLINGTGTSSAWHTVIDTAGMMGLRIKVTESGVGPSDQTSFYLDSIPAIHFFSGTHSDYHKPSDDEPLINYDGEVKIVRIIKSVVDKLNDKGKINYIKTKDDSNEDAPRFKVTLGVVPDYAFEGEGMRIDGVSDGRPAAKAGLLKGDIVIQLGEHKVTDMMTYMKALGKFTKGDTTKVKVKRGKEELEKDITF
ncbi:MAG: M28 family peptidase [Bacteroidetes bacterium]|nr:M28 family peptidase [Bacteroidota bacterium]